MVIIIFIAVLLGYSKCVMRLKACCILKQNKSVKEWTLLPKHVKVWVWHESLVGRRHALDVGQLQNAKEAVC